MSLQYNKNQTQRDTQFVKLFARVFATSGPQPLSMNDYLSPSKIKAKLHESKSPHIARRKKNKNARPGTK